MERVNAEGFFAVQSKTSVDVQFRFMQQRVCFEMGRLLPGKRSEDGGEERSKSPLIFQGCLDAHPYHPVIL